MLIGRCHFGVRCTSVSRKSPYMRTKQNKKQHIVTKTLCESTEDFCFLQHPRETVQKFDSRVNSRWKFGLSRRFSTDVAQYAAWLWRDHFRSTFAISCLENESETLRDLLRRLAKSDGRPDVAEFKWNFQYNPGVLESGSRLEFLDLTRTFPFVYTCFNRKHALISSRWGQTMANKQTNWYLAKIPW